MKYALIIFTLLLSIVCIGKGTSKGTAKFEAVFFSIMSLLFLVVAIWVGGAL